MACLRTKLNFLANGCVLGKNARKETLFKILSYFQDNINLLSAPFLNLKNGIGLFFLSHFHPYALLAGNLEWNSVVDNPVHGTLLYLSLRNFNKSVRLCKYQE